MNTLHDLIQFYGLISRGQNPHVATLLCYAPVVVRPVVVRPNRVAPPVELHAHLDLDDVAHRSSSYRLAVARTEAFCATWRAACLGLTGTGTRCTRIASQTHQTPKKAPYARDTGLPGSRCQLRTRRQAKLASSPGRNLAMKQRPREEPSVA